MSLAEIEAKIDDAIVAAALGPRAIALDATAAMLAQVPDFAPDALRVRADLAALPFRTGALGGAHASKSRPANMTSRSHPTTAR